jgi:hypothetical protein
VHPSPVRLADGLNALPGGHTWDVWHCCPGSTYDFVAGHRHWKSPGSALPDSTRPLTGTEGCSHSEGLTTNIWVSDWSSEMPGRLAEAETE